MQIYQTRQGQISITDAFLQAVPTIIVVCSATAHDTMYIRVNMFRAAVYPDDLLNCMTGLQISCADFGTLEIWSFSLKICPKDLQSC
jgi:hypothetical protein